MGVLPRYLVARKTAQASHRSASQYHLVLHGEQQSLRTRIVINFRLAENVAHTLRFVIGM